MPNEATKKWLFYAAIAVFVIGIAFTLINLVAGKFAAETGTARVAPLADSTAAPEFEIGYLVIELSRLKKMLQHDSTVFDPLLDYPVLNNDITQRILKDSPLIVPDYTNMPVSFSDLNYFKRLLKQKTIKLNSTTIACLLIRQKGSGRADNVVLDYDQAMLPVFEMYDATDINGIIARPADSTLTIDYEGFTSDYLQKQASLDTMDTGSGILVPLCIMNFFKPVDPESEDYEAWKQVTNGIVIVPAQLRYKKPNMDTAQIKLAEFLMKPVVLSDE